MKPIQLLLVALLLMVSPCLYAAKPVKDQEIKTGPVRSGNLISCDVANQTDADLTVGITIYYVYPRYTEVNSDFIEVLLPPNSVRRNSVPTSHMGGHCKITWQGEVGDIRGTACSFYSADPDIYQFFGCSDAY